MLTDTTRKMASVQKIASLAPIENSDFLEVAMMENLGWKVVVKKGEFKVGDKVIYFEIDSAINVKDLPECLAFLKDKGTKKLFTGRTPETSAFSEEYVRIKTIKLRGQVSQGLIVDFEEAAKKTHYSDGESAVDFLVDHIPEEKCEVGSDLTQEFHVEVWDRLVEWYEERSQLGPQARAHAAGNFPSWCPKTDEIRLESLMEYFNDPEMVNAEWECTVKEDGSSQTLFYCPEKWPDAPMKIASRRFLLKDDGSSDDWVNVLKTSSSFDVLQEKLRSLYENGIPKFPPKHEIAIQAEHTGSRFNGNRDRKTEDHFSVFRIFDVTDQKFVSPDCRYAICKFLGLEHVPVIETCKIFQKLKTIDDFERYVDRKSNNGNQIEGVVFKRIDNGSISFKKVSAKYLLKSDQ